MAIRSRVTPNVGRLWYFSDYYLNGSGPFIFTSAHGPVPVGTDRQQGETLPDYRVRIARKQDASTDYVRAGYSYTPSFLRGTTLTRTTLDRWDSKGFFLSTPSSAAVAVPEDSSVSDLALARLKRRLASNIGSVEAFAPIAELGELRRTIRGSARLTIYWLRELIRIKKTRGRSAATAGAQAWLNFNFALAPLVRDTDSILRSILHYMEMENRTIRVTGTASRDWTTDGGGGVYTGLYGAPRRESSSVRYKLSYRWIAGINWNLRCSNNYGITDHLGLGLDEIPATAWELTGLSWVVDYFSNVGNYLSDTFVVPPGLTQYVVRSKKLTVEVSTTNRYELIKPFGSDPQYTVLSQHFVPGYLTYERLDRTKHAALPRTGLHFNSADQIAQSEVKRLLNLASVLISMRNWR